MFSLKLLNVFMNLVKSVFYGKEKNMSAQIWHNISRKIWHISQDTNMSPHLMYSFINSGITKRRCNLAPHFLELVFSMSILYVNLCVIFLCLVFIFG